MDCLFPPALSDGQLLAYVEGEATPDITAHMAQCPPCQKRATALARQQRRLRATLYRAACPPSLALGEYQLRLLPPARMLSIQTHLQSCPHCQRELAQLSGFLADEAVAPMIETGPSPLTSVRVLIAQLIDQMTNANPFGGPTPALAGLRGAPEEQYVYAAEEIQVIIEVKDDPQHVDRHVILGLVLGLDLSQPAMVSLGQVGQMLATEAIDDLGNFVFAALLSGLYTLQIRATEVEVQLPDLQIG